MELTDRDLETISAGKRQVPVRATAPAKAKPNWYNAARPSPPLTTDPGTPGQPSSLAGVGVAPSGAGGGCVGGSCGVGS